MIRKDVDKQIYLRERDKIGNVDPTVITTNYNFTVNKQNSNVYTIPIQWTKNYYIFERQSSSGGLPLTYDINDFSNYHGSISNKKIPQYTEGFFDILTNGENAAYTCIIRSGSGLSSTIIIKNNPNNEDNEIIYSVCMYYNNSWYIMGSGNSSKNKPINIQIPENIVATIAIVIYSSTVVLPSNSVNNITIETMFNVTALSWEEGSFATMEQPRWFSNGLYSSANPVTRNVSTMLIWRHPDNKVNFAGTGIYRNSRETVGHQINSSYINSIGVSSAYVSSSYGAGTTVYYNDVEYVPIVSKTLNANLFTNGYMNSKNGWEFYHTGGTGVLNASTANVVPIYSINGGDCICVSHTVTATSRTSYMKSTDKVKIPWYNGELLAGIPYDIDVLLSYKTKTDLSTPIAPIIKIMYLSSNDGTKCTVSSSVGYGSVNNRWGTIRKTLLFYNIDNNGDESTIPQTCRYLQPYIYTAIGSTSCSGKFYFSGLFIGQYNTLSSDNNTINHSTEPLTYVSFNDRLTVPSNSHTFDIFEMDTSVGNFGNTFSASAPAINYTVNKTRTGGLFNGGINVPRYQMIEGGTVHPTSNRFPDGNFYTTSSGVYYYNLSTPYVSYSDTAFCGGYSVKINSQLSSVSQCIYKPFLSYEGSGNDLTGATSLCISAWAKAATPIAAGDNPKLMLGVTLAPVFTAYKTVSSASFGLTSEWKRYKFKANLTATSVVTAYIGEGFIGVPRYSKGTILINGVTVTQGYGYYSNIPSVFSKSSTDNTVPVQVISLDTASSLFGNYGSLSFYWTPQCDSSGYESLIKKITLLERYKNDNSYIKMEWDGATSNPCGYRFIQNDGTEYITDIATSVGIHTNIPVFISLRWTPERYYPTINRYHTSATRLHVASVNSLLIGTDHDRRYMADGTYTNLRIDTCFWDDGYTYIQSIARQYHPDSYNSLSYFSYAQNSHLADVPVSGRFIQPYFDNYNLVNGRLYEYTLDFYDTYGNRGAKSDKRTINAGDTTAPSAVTATASETHMDYVVFNWTMPSEKDTYKAYLFKDRMKSISSADACVYGNYSSQQQYVWYNIWDSNIHKLYVLPSDVWGNYDTANVVYITGEASIVPKNFAMNGGVEKLTGFSNYATPIGWEEVYKADKKYSGGKYMVPFGKYAIHLKYKAPSETSNIIVFPAPLYDSATVYCMSLWIYDKPSTNQYFYWLGYNLGGEELEREFKVAQPNGESFTLYNATGDPSVWYRYTATVAATALASVSSFKVMGIELSGSGAGDGVYGDNLQVEYGLTPSKYQENYITTQYNVPLKTILGNTIQENTVTMNAMVDNAINIGNAAGEGSYVLVGKQATDSAYVYMSPNNLKYHVPGMPTSAGYTITKHIEGGVAYFDTTIAFNKSYLGAFGEKKAPYLIVTMDDVMVTSTSIALDTGLPQKLKIIKIATSGGFYCNAFLYQSLTDSHPEWFPVLANSTASNKTLYAYNPNASNID